MMTGDPHPVTITAETFASVLEVPRVSMEILLKKDETLGAALEQAMQQESMTLDQDEVARSSDPRDEGGTLLARIRSFLHGKPSYMSR